MSHISVMMDEAMEALSPKNGEFIIDGTLGAGGHAREIARLISPGGTLLGVDRDENVIQKTEINIPGVKVILVNANFARLPEILESKSLPLADGLLLDLGFSSDQLDSGRGFSFLNDEPLLMTYSDEDEPLYKTLRRLSREDLKEIISVSGERYAHVIAEAIWKAERKNPIETTGKLVEIIRSVLPSHYEHGRINPATRTFLALRIFANKELQSLENVLESLPKILKPGGRAAIITFQSLEDKIVKNKFKEMARAGIVSLLTKKPTSPKYSEIKINPKARSAKLRAAIMN
ncbi:MAG: 16S rRNA (cytosine(1402)-N(4))-methyltransferase RsmH [Parcubacteria group bacterium]